MDDPDTYGHSVGHSVGQSVGHSVAQPAKRTNRARVWGVIGKAARDEVFRLQGRSLRLNRHVRRCCACRNAFSARIRATSVDTATWTLAHSGVSSVHCPCTRSTSPRHGTPRSCHRSLDAARTRLTRNFETPRTT